MSRKRSANEAFPTTKGDFVLRKALMIYANDVPAPLSAFAAARAKAATSASTQAPVVNGVVTAQDLLHGTQFTSHEPLRRDDLPKESDADSLSSGDSIADQEAELVATPTNLSSLRPENVLVQDQDVVLHLQTDDSACLIGFYDLEVQQGSVLVNGALLRPGPVLSRIFAPSTHALPCITAKSGPATVAIHSISNDLVSLARLSPLWSRLWNEDPSGRSFQLVRIPSRLPKCG